MYKQYPFSEQKQREAKIKVKETDLNRELELALSCRAIIGLSIFTTPCIRFLGCSCRCLAAQMFPTLCRPMDCSPPGSSVHGILQARILEWLAIPFSRGIFPTQGSNPGLSHGRQILYCLSHHSAAVNIEAHIFSNDSFL